MAGVVGLWQPDADLSAHRFEGARQPFAPRALAGSLLDNPPSLPPFRDALRGAAALSEVVFTAQPDPWQYVYGKSGTAARQPYGLAQLPPVKLDNPPNNPPIVSEGRSNWYPSLLGAWQPDPDVAAYRYAGTRQPFAPRTLAPSVLDNPPSNPPFRWLDTVVEPFLPPDPLPSLPGVRKLAGAQIDATADNPPFGQLDTIIEPWRGDAPLQTLPRHAPPTPPAAQTPYAVPLNVLAAWQITDPLPSLPVRSAGIPGWSVDNPPPLLRPPLPPSDTAPPLPWQPRYVVQTPLVGQVSYNLSWLPTVLAAWQPVDPPPLLRLRLNPAALNVTPDNPPFGFLDTIIEPWLGDPLAPTLPRVGIPPPAVFQTPFAQGWVPGVIASWQAPDPLPTLPRYGVQPSTVPDNPPFSDAGRAPYLVNVGLAWQPGPPQPQGPSKLNPASLNVTADNPPFGFLDTIIEPWLGDAPQPVQFRRVPQSTPAVQNPYSLTWLSGVLSAWQVSDPQPILPLRSAGIPGWSVDNPPGLPATDMLALDAPPQSPQQPSKLPAALLTITPDNPPFPGDGRPPYLVNVILSWQPPDPPPVQRGPLNPSFLNLAPDNPPFGFVDTIIEPWLPPAPMPQAISGRLIQEGPVPPAPSFEFTVSGPDVRDLFGPVGDVSWNWGGGVSKRTV